MSRVQRLDVGPFGIGSRVRIKQPRLPATIWQVTEFTAQQSFSWTASSGGLTTTADHTVAPTASGTVTVTLTLRQSGLLAPLIGLLTSALIRRYVDTELQGLTLRAESHTP